MPLSLDGPGRFGPFWVPRAVGTPRPGGFRVGYCQPLAARAPQASHQRPGQRTDSPPAFPLHLGFGEAPRDETAFLPLTNLPSLSLSPLCAKSPSSREASGSTWRPALGEDLACASLLSTVGVRRTQEYFFEDIQHLQLAVLTFFSNKETLHQHSWPGSGHRRLLFQENTIISQSL